MVGKEYDDFAKAPDLISMTGRLSTDLKDSRGGKGKSGGGRGGGRGGDRPQNRETQVSRALSQLLRHKAEAEGIVLDNEGFARLDQVMKWHRLKSLYITFEDILIAVNDNAKQRFAMKPNPKLAHPDLNSTAPSDWMIRANQGHTIVMSSEALHTSITATSNNVPEVVVHGTFFYFWPFILESGGLKKMDRNHIHFSTGLPEEKAGVISGMRGDAEILIYVDIRKALDDGVVWWLSQNGVVLTEGDESGLLNTKYWKKVVGRKQNVGVLWEDGRVVAELPAHLRKLRPPRGKEISKATSKPMKKKALGSKAIKGGKGEEKESKEPNVLIEGNTISYEP